MLLLQYSGTSFSSFMNTGCWSAFSVDSENKNRYLLPENSRTKAARLILECDAIRDISRHLARSPQLFQFEPVT